MLMMLKLGNLNTFYWKPVFKHENEEGYRFFEFKWLCVQLSIYNKAMGEAIVEKLNNGEW